MKDGKKFEGDKLKHNIGGPRYSTVGQIGDMNCGPAAGEAVDKSFWGEFDANDIEIYQRLKGTRI